MLLVPASTVILCSESRRTHDRTLLSQDLGVVQLSTGRSVGTADSFLSVPRMIVTALDVNIDIKSSILVPRSEQRTLQEIYLVFMLIYAVAMTVKATCKYCSRILGCDLKYHSKFFISDYYFRS
jgi:hypothetical protein